jgi:hypothetical protein
MPSVEYVEQLPELAPPRQLRKRFLWGAVILVLVALAGGFLYYQWLLYEADRDRDQIIAELDASDPRWRLEEIEADRKVIPDDQNAALIIMQINARMPGRWPGAPKPSQPSPLDIRPLQDRLSDLAPEQDLEPEDYWELRQDLDRVKPLILQVRGIAKLQEGRYPLNWSEDFIGTSVKCQDARNVVNLLQLDTLARLRERNWEGAVESERAMLVAARSIGDEPLFVSQFVRLSCVGMVVNCLERVLAQGQYSGPDLASLQKLLEEEEARPTLVQALRGERGGYERLLECLEDGRRAFSQLNAQVTPSANRLESMLQNSYGKYIARRGHGFVLRKLTELIQIAQLPPQDRLKRFRAYEQELRQPNTAALGRLLLPAIVKFAEADLRVHAAVRCAAAAIAAERFRNDHERWPHDLGELVPNYLSTAPTDLYDGQPLRWRVFADGVVIYSVGPDLEDNGGVMDRQHPDAKGSDLAFRLWNVDKRRQPAINPEMGPPRPSAQDLARDELEAEGKPWQIRPGNRTRQVLQPAGKDD